MRFADRVAKAKVRLAKRARVLVVVPAGWIVPDETKGNVTAPLDQRDAGWIAPGVLAWFLGGKRVDRERALAETRAEYALRGATRPQDASGGDVEGDVAARRPATVERRRLRGDRDRWRRRASYRPRRPQVCVGADVSAARADSDDHW